MDINKEITNYIHISKYSRWIESESRRETWKETVDRLYEFWEDQTEPLGFTYEQSKEVADVFDDVENMRIVPSMRSLMTAGKALERDHAAGFNCFSGDTRFITSGGVKSFLDFEEGSTVEVLNIDGDFVPATVSCYGKQKLQEVTFRPNKGASNARRRYKVTEDHRWYTQRGVVTDLKVGDKVTFTGYGGDFNREWYIRGLLFGDGTLDTRGRARIRLCGGKKGLLSYFREEGNSSIMSPSSFNGDPLVVFHKGYFADCKELPYTTLSPDKICSWIEGYLSADSSNEGGTIVLSSQDSEALDFVEQLAPMAGLSVTGRSVSSNTETNFGIRKNPLGLLRLRPLVDFFVTSVEALDLEEDVFCVEEPLTSTFTLEYGVPTGNCAGKSVDHQRVFDEIFYLLMCGCGVGFSVERQYINQMLEVAEDFHDTETTIDVQDSKMGWAKGLKELIALLYNGDIPLWDLSSIRPAGARLKTFGGRASGPEPLDGLFRYVVRLFTRAAGRRLNSLECHDLICKIADTVIVGSVRRSACISLSNLTDQRMARAKRGEWYLQNPERMLANNSVAYTEKPDLDAFTKEMRNLYQSKAGERGIINKVALREKAEERGREHDGDYILNPLT